MSISASEVSTSRATNGAAPITSGTHQHRFEPKVMLLTIILLVIIVCVIQIVFDRLSTRLDKRNR